jgi:hypothetical protein
VVTRRLSALPGSALALGRGCVRVRPPGSVLAPGRGRVGVREVAAALWPADCCPRMSRVRESKPATNASFGCLVFFSVGGPVLKCS